MLKYVVMRRRTDCTNMWSGALASDFIEQTLLDEAKKGGRYCLPLVINMRLSYILVNMYMCATLQSQNSINPKLICSESLTLRIIASSR